MKKVFRATRKDQYVQPVEFDPGRYTFHASVKGEAYSFALKTENGVWLSFDLSWQLEDDEWSRITHTFDLTEKCVEFSIFASDTASEVLIGDPMLEEGNNRSTPSPHPADGFEQTRVSFDILDDKIVAEITGENGRLTKAEQTLDGIETTVYDPDTGESKITQLANEIETKVSKDGVISSINVSTEGIDISAERINFTGSVKFESAVRDEVQGDLDGLASDIQDAQQAVNDLDAYVDGAFKNGVIEEAEAKAIEKYLNSLSETKLSVDSAYTQVYNNTYLEGEAKTNLASAKTALNTAYTDLVNSINVAIAGDATTPAEKADVDAKFGLFNTAIAAYQTRLEEANKAIQNKIKSFADDAQDTADDAQAKANTSKAITDKFGTTIDGGLINTVTMELREADTQDVTAGISGIQNGGNGVAFWAGGTYAQAIAGAAKAIIRHDGSVKFTDGEFNGTITAVTGELGTLTMLANGYIKFPPNFGGSYNGQISASGIDMAFSGNNSQKIEWYGGLGAYSGRIACNASGQLVLSSSYGVNIGTDFLGSAITIKSSSLALFAHEIDFNDSLLQNVRWLRNLGLTQYRYVTASLNANTNTTVSTDVSLLIYTSVGVGGSIVKILINNSTPENGTMVIIYNASGTDIILKDKISGGNIRTGYTGGPWHRILPNTYTKLIYYSGYWRLHTDWGQIG